MKRPIAIILVISTLTYLIDAQGMGGVSTGEARSYSTRKTVGITDPSASKVFEDVTALTPLKNYYQEGGGKTKNYIPETVSGSVAVLDFDNDGKPDIYFLNGGSISGIRGTEKVPKSALYRNLGNWKFEDVTAEAGVSNERWGMGVAVGDYNNDGFADIFVSNFGIARLYKNNGNGTFTDVAEKVGLNINGWFTGPTFGDYDGDGRLDLFVPSYIDFDINKPPASPSDVRKGDTDRNFCQFRGQPTMCGPRGLAGGQDRLFRQKDDGTFEDVSKKAGVTDEGHYYGFSSVFVDVDNDNDLDLVVINDSTPNQLYLNKGNGFFEEVGYPSGIALNENGREQAGMGLAVGDYDNDGLVDFHVTNFSDDSNTLYHNDGQGNFTDITFQSGLGESTIPFLGWGTVFLDYDNDGWKDILVGNGHVYPQVDNFQWGTSYAQQMLLFRNKHIDPKYRLALFERVGAAPNSGLAVALQARGIASADFDNDGKIDVVVNSIDSAPTLLRNVTTSTNNWLTLRMIGDASKKCPADAIGSVVYISAGGITQRYEVTSGGSYASQPDQRITVGLGTAARIDKLEVRWPSGSREMFKPPAPNQILSIRQGTGAAVK